MITWLALLLCSALQLGAAASERPTAWAELPGDDVVSSEHAPALADDHGTRAGTRLAHAAVDRAGRAALLFAEPRAFAVSLRDADAGAEFAAPLRVPTDAPLAMGSFWGPRVALDAQRVLVVGVLSSRGGRAGDVFAWRSDDAGAHFAEPVRLNALQGAAQEFIVELAVGPEGRLVVAWMHTDDGVVSLHGVESDDFGASWSVDRALVTSTAGSLCPCCPPALAYAPDGRGPWVLYRDDVDGFRDMHLLELHADAGRPASAQRLGATRWELAGCPMSVPTLRIEADGPVAVSRRGDELFVHRAAAESESATRADPGDIAGDTDTDSAASRGLAEQRLVAGRWPLHTLLRQGDARAPLLLWRDGPSLRARVPGAFLDSDLGRARRVVLADSLDPAGPVLLAAELDDGDAGWRLSLRLLQAVAR